MKNKLQITAVDEIGISCFFCFCDKIIEKSMYFLEFTAFWLLFWADKLLAEEIIY